MPKKTPGVSGVGHRAYAFTDQLLSVCLAAAVVTTLWRQAAAWKSSLRVVSIWLSVGTPCLNAMLADSHSQQIRSQENLNAIDHVMTEPGLLHPIVEASQQHDHETDFR